MKKYFLSAIIALGALSLASCSDELRTMPEGSYLSDSYFQNDQQAIDAIDAVYAQIARENMWGRAIYWEQVCGNQVVWGRTRSFNTLATTEYTGDEAPLTGFWEQCYKFGARANWIVSELLKKQSETQLSAIETRSLGEAYFLRAFYHFYIAYRYGTADKGVPFVRYEDYPEGYNYSIPQQQESVMKNYELIIADLTEAEKYLDTTYGESDFGRATKAAAVGYMARTYAYWACWDASKWNNVISCVDRLEGTYGRALVADYNDLFTDDITKWNNSEYLFAIPSNGGANGGGTEFPGVVLENKAWGIYNGWGQFKPSLDSYEILSNDDNNLIDPAKGNVRKSRSLLEYGDKFLFNGEERTFYSNSDVESGFQINKFMQPFSHADFTASDSKGMGYVNTDGDFPTARVCVPLLRFADCLLLRAEAKLMTGKGGADADINQVRNRANIKSLDHTATMADIYQERWAELAFEFYDHAYDLKRWHKSGDATIKALAEKELTTNARVRIYANRLDPNSAFTVGNYGDPATVKTGSYNDGLITFPFPSAVVAKSNGALVQNEYWSKH